MKKTNIQPQQEIKSQDIQSMNNFLEQAISLFSADLLGVTDGVIFGLEITQNVGFNNRLTVASGAIFQDRIFGELESTSGFIVNLPVSGTKTDLLVASYIEVTDTPSTGYILLDTDTRLETVESFYTRKLGAVKLELLEHTAASGTPAGKIAVAQVTSNNTGITVLTDSRAFSIMSGLNGENIQISGGNTTKVKAYIDAVIASKGQANGIATLGADTKLEPAQVPTITTAMLGANSVTNIAHVATTSGGSAPTQGTLANITGLSTSITVSAGSSILVMMSVNDITVSNGSATSIYTGGFGLNGTDYEVGSMRSAPTYTSGSGAISGTRIITGVPAGTYTVQGKHRQSGGGTSMVATANGLCTLTIIEIKK